MSESTSGTEPEFGGQCAFGVAFAGAKAPAGKPQHTLVKDGRTYVFSAAVPKLLFQLIPGSAERAQRKWNGA